MPAAPRHRHPVSAAEEEPRYPEYKRQGPPSVSRFFTFRVTSVIMGTLAAFTATFAKLERWSLLDSFYFVCSTASTIGFGDLRPTSAVARLLTCILGLLGVALLGNLVSAMLEQKLFDEQPLPRDNVVGRWWGNLGLKRRSCALFALLLAAGVLGLRAFEDAASRPSWALAAYLSCGTLTTAGLGDVVPVSRAARVFASLYSLVGTVAFARIVGRLALRPLEREREAAQRGVLRAYGDVLTEETLEALARGPLVKRLGLSQDDSFCSRDEYALLLLVQQGKVSEADLAEVRASFDTLDVDKSGRLWRRDLEILESDL